MRLSPTCTCAGKKVPATAWSQSAGPGKQRTIWSREALREKRSWLEFAMPPLPKIPFDEQDATLFHTPNGMAYADVQNNGHRETWPICSKSFRNFLRRCIYKNRGKALNSGELNRALQQLEAQAQFDGPERDVHVRVGGLEGKIYIDLCDEEWRVVEVDSNGWRLVHTPPIRFERKPGMRPLPVPAKGGSIEALRSFLNVRSDDDFVIAVAWVLAALRDCGPYPILALGGEQGSGKSTFTRVLRALVDPNTAPLRAPPRDERDFFISAINAHVLAFDNLSSLSPRTSDILCRLSTGGGFSTRKLRTDQDEEIFAAAKPVILNGIEDVVNRADLADRAVFLHLEAIPEERRRTENEFWADFEVELPRIFGALLNGVAKGLAMLPKTKLGKLPRMADFALWASACETALWPAGTFLKAYDSNRDDANEIMIDSDPVAAAVLTMMTTRTGWAGTASDLLDVLGRVAGDGITRAKGWPKAPQALSGRLRRAATLLRKSGIEIHFEREGHGRTRTIHITRLVPDNKGAQSSASSAYTQKAEEGNGFTVPGADGADDADAKFPPSEMGAPERLH